MSQATLPTIMLCSVAVVFLIHWEMSDECICGGTNSFENVIAYCIMLLSTFGCSANSKNKLVVKNTIKRRIKKTERPFAFTSKNDN